MTFVFLIALGICSADAAPPAELVLRVEPETARFRSGEPVVVTVVLANVGTDTVWSFIAGFYAEPALPGFPRLTFELRDLADGAKIYPLPEPEGVDYSLMVPTSCSVLELTPGALFGQRVSLSAQPFAHPALRPGTYTLKASLGLIAGAALQSHLSSDACKRPLGPNSFDGSLESEVVRIEVR